MNAALLGMTFSPPTDPKLQHLPEQLWFLTIENAASHKHGFKPKETTLEKEITKGQVTYHAGQKVKVISHIKLPNRTTLDLSGTGKKRGISTKVWRALCYLYDVRGYSTMTITLI